MVIGQICPNRSSLTFYDDEMLPLLLRSLNGVGGGGVGRQQVQKVLAIVLFTLVVKPETKLKVTKLCDYVKYLHSAAPDSIILHRVMYLITVSICVQSSLASKEAKEYNFW
jgi:hypothetical protein